MNVFRAIVLAALSCLLWSPLPSLAGDVVIGDYTLVSSKRIARTVYENTYKADVSNWGTADSTITASLTSTAAHITVVEGALSFGDVPIGATVESSDTFTVRHDRSRPFDEAALVWAAQAIPLPPTTFGLINKTLNEGLIDAETALVYRVFDEFNDSRLPAQYRGRDDGFFEATAIREARKLFTSLSPATQQLLAPFLLIPDVTEIALSTPSAPSAGTKMVAVPSNTLNNTGQPTISAAAAPTNLSGIWAVPDEVHVAWENDNPAVEAYLEEWAQKSAAEIKNVIWPKLTGLFGKPTPGKFVGILLTPTGLKRSMETSADCKVATIRLTTQNVNTLAHELTHALIDLNYPEKCNSSDTLWLHEATATWAEHFVYPKNNREHVSAPSFLGRPEVELEKYEQSQDDKPGPEHQYGAYLWFLYITRGSDSGAHYVKETWDAIFNHDSLGAIEEAIGSLGGFRGEWPQFVLYNWNRLAKGKIVIGEPGKTEIGKPYRYYASWDKLNHKAKEMTPEPVKVSLNGKTSFPYPLIYMIPHLAANYFHYDFTADKAIRSFTFTHPYANGSEPTVRVQAIVKIRDQEWKPAEDWTSLTKKYFCRDKPGEDVEELVIVISNSEFTDRSHVLSSVDNFVDPAELKVSALGCNPWIGSVQFSYSYTDAAVDITETATASNVIFDLIDSDKDGASAYEATSGIVNWSHTGSASFGSTKCSGKASGTFLVVPGYSTMLVSTFSPPFGDDSTLFYSALGEVSLLDLNVEQIFYTCDTGIVYTPEQQWMFPTWLFTSPPSDLGPGSWKEIITDSDGNLVMKGNSKLGPRKWQWEFKQMRKAP